MIKCPSCGFNNPDSRDKCLKCRTALTSQPVPDGTKLAARGPDVADPMIPLRRAMYFLGRKLRGKLPEGLPRRYPWSAAYLSICFGAGQIYNRQPFKAGLFALIQTAILGAVVYTWFLPSSDWVVLGLFFWLLYAMADAFSIAVKINNEAWNWRNLFAMWFALIFMVSALISLGQFFGYGLFYMSTVKARTYYPGIQRGDKMFTWAPFSDSMVKRGSVIYYNPPALDYERPGALSNDIYSLNEQNGFGVITGIEGDVVSWTEEGPIMVNGVPAPSQWLPPNPNGYPGSMTVTVPKDSICVVYTQSVEENGFLSSLGGSFGSSVPNPRQAAAGGFVIKNYKQAIIVPKKDIFGIVLFRYYPPPRRDWFGTSGGLWEQYPSDYRIGDRGSGNGDQ